MTGVEAVSNGVKAFREPVVDSARRTLTIIIGLLILLLAGIAYLVRAYGIGATDPGQPGYQSVLSMLLLAVAGKGVFYYISIASILLVLALSANTAFADFPRLCRAIALNGFLPHSFASVGRRLVYSQGIYVVAALAGLLLILFRGVTDRLIPLFAVGAFLAFTLSQAGMVAHWKRVGGPGARRSMLINGLGALVTGVTVIVVLVAKFREGAWVTADGRGAPPLSQRVHGVQQPHAARTHQPRRAAGNRAHPGLEPHRQEGLALRPEDLSGHPRRARGLRRRHHESPR
jgi:amino acid transporter